jgi:hypothetical protein
MTNPEPTPPENPEDDRGASLWGTLPLIALTAVLYVGAYVAYRSFRTLGPANFPLWGLLFTLGFVGAIGAVVSWFFATDDHEPAPGSPRESRVDTPSPSSDPRADFGRPIPSLTPHPPPTPTATVVGGTAAVAVETPAPWDEDALPPVAARGPRPVLTTPEDPGDIRRALEEIAEIQRELSVRRPVPVGPRESPARA